MSIGLALILTYSNGHAALLHVVLVRYNFEVGAILKSLRIDLACYKVFSIKFNCFAGVGLGEVLVNLECALNLCDVCLRIYSYGDTVFAGGSVAASLNNYGKITLLIFLPATADTMMFFSSSSSAFTL